MGETEVKMALERIHQNNYKDGYEMGFVKKARDNYIQGIQLNVCYTEHWLNIKKVFKLNSLNLNKYGPVLTMNECRFVKEINEIPHRDGVEFMAMLHAFPIWCIKHHLKDFVKWFEDNRSELLSLRGTNMEIDKQIEEQVER